MSNPRKLPHHDAFVQAAQKAVIEQGHRPLLVGIQKDALVRNVERIRERLGPRSLCAVLKGDAYGHGVDLVAPHVSAFCSHVAFADNREAAAVRASDPDVTLLRLRIGAGAEVAEALEAGWNVREPVCSREKAVEVDGLGAHFGTIVDVHVSLDVAGLGRNGLPVDDESEVVGAVTWLLSQKNIKLASIGCHLPDAAQSNPSDPADSTRMALERFVHLVRRIRPLLDAANQELPEISAYSSASSCAFGASGKIEELGLPCFDRIGNSLFGLTSASRHPEAGTFQVMHAATAVCDCVRRRHGSTIGYERAYAVRCEEGEGIALLGVGWLSAGRQYRGVGKTDTPVFVVNGHGGRHAVLGRQSMNIATIEATDHLGRDLAIGDIVYLTTDCGGLADMPAVHVLSKLMGNVQTEFVTSSFGGSASSLRFLF